MSAGSSTSFQVDRKAKAKVARATKGRGFYDHVLPLILYALAALFFVSGAALTVMVLIVPEGGLAQMSLDLQRKHLDVAAFFLEAPIVFGISNLIIGAVLVACAIIQQKHRSVWRTSERLWIDGEYLWYTWKPPVDGDVVMTSDGHVVGIPSKADDLMAAAIDLSATRVSLDNDGFFVFEGGVYSKRIEGYDGHPLTLGELDLDPRLQEYRIGNYFGVDLRSLATSR